MDRFNSFIKSANLDAKDHQAQAVKWCIENETAKVPPLGVRGGLVADEMGLGKTIVMLGLMVSNFCRNTLIVLPLALIDQWRNEIVKTMNHEPLVYHGKKGEITLEQLQRAPIVITTYGHIVAHAKPYGKTVKTNLLQKIEWGRVIFDEAHHLRNMNTGIHHGAMKLTANIRWLITGTPIQNSKKDFYSLCHAMGMKSNHYTSAENIPTIVRHFMLKRTKKQVGINLPELHDEKIVVKWEDDEERKLASDIHSFLSFSMCESSSTDNAIAGMDSNVLSLLVKARQTCVYPKLLKKNIDPFLKAQKNENSTFFLKATNSSSKINAVISKIKERRDEGKKLVFCHYRGEIDEIKSQLEAEKFSVETFDGRTTNTKRDEILQGDNDVLILQIQTGCEGLNLQKYNEVYFVSPHWNPAIEDQAVARCHRIGQTKEVYVYRFVMESFDKENVTQTLDCYSSSVQEVKREEREILDSDQSTKSIKQIQDESGDDDDSEDDSDDDDSDDDSDDDIEDDSEDDSEDDDSEDDDSEDSDDE